MDRRRIVRTAFDEYRDSLSVRGYQSYQHYLASEAWRQFNEWYRQTPALPQYCLVCRSGQFILHHVDYRYVGQERLWDVRPLCAQHHKQLHRWLMSNTETSRHFNRHLVQCFGMPKGEVRRLTEAFLPPKPSRPKGPPQLRCRVCGDGMRKLNKQKQPICRLCRPRHEADKSSV